MFTNKYSDPVISFWETDVDGNKISIEILNEQKTVINGKITLNGLPDEFYKVQITGYNEIPFTSKIVNDTDFKVDYRNTGNVYFDSSQEGVEITVDRYYSRGVNYLPASRVWTEIDDFNNVIKTVEDISSDLSYVTEAYEQLDSIIITADNLNTNLENNISSGTTLNNNLESNIIDANNINDTLATAGSGTIDTAEAINSTLITTISDANLINGTLNTTISSADSQNTTLNNTISSASTQDDTLNTTISNADSQNTVLNTTISNADTQDGVLNTTISNAQTAQSNLEIIIGDGETLEGTLNTTLNNLTHRGTYVGTTDYYKYNIVDYNGSSYMCILDSAGNLPTNTTYWKLIGERGDQGVQGYSIEYNWSGTQLGVKTENEGAFTYVDLKGEKGDKGDTGDTGNGIDTIVRTSGTGAPGTIDTYTITYTDATTTTFQVYNGADGEGAGDMLKSEYDTNNNGKVDSAENADTVNNLTVETSVPSGAVFTDDQTATEVPYSNTASGLTATDTQNAIDEIDGNLDSHISNTNDPHDIQSNQVDYNNTTSGLTATDAQSAIDEVDGDLDAHISDTNDPHDVQATQVAYDNSTSGLTATDTQAAIDEVQDIKADKTEILLLDNTTPFTPDADYEPATKKYVDDNAGALITNNDTALENYVLASNGDGTSTFKNVINTIPPDSVTDLTVDSNISSTGDEVILSWTNPTNEDLSGTRIVYKTGSYPTSITDGTIIEPASIPQTITGLTTDTQYYFNVYAYDTDNNYSESTQITATPEIALEYGLEWNQTTDTYTRLSGAVGLTVTNNGADGIKTSDFDSAYPWSGMRLVNLADNGTVNAEYGDASFAFDGSNGQVMVEIPKFYYKTELDTTTDRIFRRWVSENQVDANYKVSPAHIVGGVEKDFIYVGAKKAYNNSGTLESKSGVAPTINQTIGTFRTQAENRGLGWQLCDANTIFMIWQFLFPIEYGTFKSQESLGQDWTDKSSATNTGSMDSYGNDSYGVVTNGLSSASYRGIENPWGNVREFIDGFIIKDDGYYLEDDYTNFNDTASGYTNTGIVPITVDGYIDDLVYDSIYNYLGLANSTNGSDSTYIPDYQYSHDSGEINIALIGGYWAKGLQAGAFLWSLHLVASYSSSAIGARLCAKF